MAFISHLLRSEASVGTFCKQKCRYRCSATSAWIPDRRDAWMAAVPGFRMFPSPLGLIATGLWSGLDSGAVEWFEFVGSHYHAAPSISFCCCSEPACPLPAGVLPGDSCCSLCWRHGDNMKMGTGQGGPLQDLCSTFAYSWGCVMTHFSLYSFFLIYKEKAQICLVWKTLFALFRICRSVLKFEVTNLLQEFPWCLYSFSFFRIVVKGTM